MIYLSKTIGAIFLLSIELLIFFPVPLSADSETERIRIAAIFALTGEASEQNSTSLRGVRLAITAVNENGGILGKPVELLVFDNGSTPIGSKIAAAKAVKADIAGIVGPDFSAHALAVARVAQENRVPMIANAAVKSEVTQVGNFIFRACFTDRFAGKILAEMVRRDHGATRAIVMTDTISDDSMGLSDQFERRFKALGGSVIHFSYKRRDADFKELVQQAATAAAEIVFLPGGGESGQIIGQAAEIGFFPVFIGGTGWEDPFFFQNRGKTLKEGYYCTHWSKEAFGRKLPKFLRHLPDQIVVAKLVLGYDATMLLLKALENAGSLDPEKVVKALSAIRDYPGISGSITMNGAGDPIKPLYIRKIANGQNQHLKTIYP